MTCRSHFWQVLIGIVSIAWLGLGCQQPSSQRDASPAKDKPMTLEDVSWHLAEVGGKPAEPVPADAPAPHLRLHAKDRRVTGYSGVNAFNGSYELNGQSLKFGPTAMTRRAGPEPLMKQEFAFTQAMEQTASWRDAGDGRIDLLDAAGKPLAQLRRIPTDRL